MKSVVILFGGLERFEGVRVVTSLNCGTCTVVEIEKSHVLFKCDRCGHVYAVPIVEAPEEVRKCMFLCQRFFHPGVLTAGTAGVRHVGGGFRYPDGDEFASADLICTQILNRANLSFSQEQSLLDRMRATDEVEALVEFVNRTATDNKILEAASRTREAAKRALDTVLMNERRERQTLKRTETATGKDHAAQITKRFTDRAHKVKRFATSEAQRFNHEYIGSEHILLGLVKEGSGVASNVLKNLDVDLQKVRLETEKLLQLAPEMVTMGVLPQSPRAKNVIKYSIEEANSLNHNYVGTEHILLGLLREQEGIAAQVFINLGLKLGEVREEVLRLLGRGS